MLLQCAFQCSDPYTLEGEGERAIVYRSGHAVRGAPPSPQYKGTEEAAEKAEAAETAEAARRPRGGESRR